MMGRSAALAPTVTCGVLRSPTTSAWFHFLWHGNGSSMGDGKPFGCSVRCPEINTLCHFDFDPLKIWGVSPLFFVKQRCVSNILSG
jgi:hypothetical protein